MTVNTAFIEYPDEPKFTPPAHLWIPDRFASFGPEIIEFSEMIGLNLDADQKFCIDAIASIHADGSWVASEIGIVEPRQNGKTTHIVLPMTMYDLFMGEPDEMMHTAHRFITARKTFEKMKLLIDGCYDIRRYVKRIVDSHGSESIELINGSILMFLARSDIGGRGLGGKRVDLDEAFALIAGQLGALMPTMLARNNSQVVYSSSAGMKRSSVMREVRDRGRAGGDPALIYIEYCADGDWDNPGCEQVNCNHHRTTPGCALDKVENRMRANPAILQGRFTLPKIALMRRSMTPMEFAREILGWWDEPEEMDVIPIKEEEWNACKDETSRITGPIAIAFDVAPDRATSAIGIAGLNAADAIHGELVEYGPSTDWLARRIKTMKEKNQVLDIIVAGKRRPAIICDPSSPANAILPMLQMMGIEPILMTARDMSAACGGLQDAVKEGKSKFVHPGQTQLDLAILNAARRPIGDGGWAFGRKRSAESSTDICPGVSVTMARWAVTVASRPVLMPRWG